MATRPAFGGMSAAEIDVFYGLAVVSMTAFLWGCAVLIAKYRQGRREPVGELVNRVLGAMWSVLDQRTVRRRDRVAGLGHALIFYGFLTLLLGTTVLGLQVDLTKPVFHWVFWRGPFYLGFKACLDLGGALMLLGLAIMGVRRGLIRPARLDYRRPDRATGDYDRRRYVVGDWMFLSFLMFLGVSGFLLEGLQLDESNGALEHYSPVGWAIAELLSAAGLGARSAIGVHHVIWWVHAVVALTFIATVPFTKALHMLAGPANLIVRDARGGRVLARVPSGSLPIDIGVGSIEDLTSSQLVGLDACTRCGKCHEVCPANLGGYPLSPRDLVLDLRDAAEGSMGLRKRTEFPPVYPSSMWVLGEPVRPETVWSCTQCMACVEICPVGIQHVPIINGLRRRLVERGELDATLQAAFENVYKSGNSFGEPARARAKWTKQLDFVVKDIRKEAAELLWFVGDYASFDPRNQRVSRALAGILHECGVDFGILFDAEKTGGCDIRRAGEEGLFASLVEANIRTISQCTFERIFSSDAHGFHTLKNDYPEFGGKWTVLHHSELLWELLSTGRLTVRRQLGYKVTYHDPCSLGRYNGVFEAPRNVLRALGLELKEMPRNRDNSFCCGAGGGRIWMKEGARPGARRPSEQRIDEAVGIGALDYFVVACPKDVTMYEDAIRTSGHEGELELRELSELVLEAVTLAPATDRPTTVE